MTTIETASVEQLMSWSVQCGELMELEPGTAGEVTAWELLLTRIEAELARRLEAQRKGAP